MNFFKNIHYDKTQKAMYVWEYENGKTIKRKRELATNYFVPSNEPTEWKSIEGKFMQMKTLQSRESPYKIKQQYKSQNKQTGEMNYDKESKYLLWNYNSDQLNSELNDVGFNKVFNVGYFDIEVDVENEFPNPTEVKYPISLISVVSNGKTTTFGSRPYTGDSDVVKDYYHIPDEKRLLEKFFSFITKEYIDILSGWYSNGFDMPYIFNRYLSLIDAVPEYESKWESVYRIEGLPLNKVVYEPHKGRWVIPGITHIDYMDIYEQLTYDPHDSYGLDYVARRNINKGKLEYEGSMSDFWKKDWNRFVEYNIIDTVLIKEVNDAIAFIELYVTFAYSSLIPISKCESSIAQIEGYIIQYLHKKGLVLPDVKKGIRGEFEGAYVMAKKGHFKNCFSFDATSLYPSIIMQWNVSPETLVMNPSEEEKKDLISTTTDGQYYRKDIKGIIPEIMEVLFDTRVGWKDKLGDAKTAGDKRLIQYYHNQQMNYKILANSFYGVLGHESFTFYNLTNASIIPALGQAIIRYFGEEVAQKIFVRMSHVQFLEIFPEWEISEEMFNEAKEDYLANSHVLTDTDSYYICMDAMVTRIKTTDNFLEMGYKFIDRLYDPYTKIKATKWSDQFNPYEYRIDFKREKIITDMIIFARKKYVSYTLDSEGKVYGYNDKGYGASFDVTGLEIKRTDTAIALQKFAREVLDWIVDGKDYTFINSEIIRLRAKFEIFDYGDICIRKGIKDIKKYMVEDPIKGALIKHTPMQNKLAMQYNVIKKDLGLFHLEDANSGSKLRYVFVNIRNPWGVNCICWVGEPPLQILKHFQIDYGVQFEKAVMSMVNRTFDAIGWDDPVLHTQQLAFI